MKRYRVKAMGLGMALWAGYLHGADAPPPAGVTPPPALLPATVRAADWSAGPAVSDTVWLPARPATLPTAPAPMPAPSVTVVPAAPSALPSVVVPEVAGQVKPASSPGLAEAPIGPRQNGIINVGPMPEIPMPEIPLPLAPVAPTAPAAPLSALPAPGAFPIPEAAAPLPELPTIPTAIPSVQPKIDPLPKPRPVPPPIPPSKDVPDLIRPSGELPTAPPELMVPHGMPVPGKHGTFGSSPVRISNDYPSVRDMMDHDSGWWSSLWGGRGTSADPATIATDRLEVRGEYLLWWMNPQQIPVLATTSTDGGFGFLGQPGTQTLLGPGAFGNSLRSGLRVRAGYWFDDCGSWGVDGGFFFLGKQTTTQAFDSATTPTITRPIYAPNFPGEFGEIVAMPGLSTGALTVTGTSSIWGFDANIRRALCKSCDFRSEVFAGYRFVGLNESLTINEFITALPDNPNDPAGTRITVTDQFKTQNRFNGGQIGYAAEKIWNRFSVDGRASVAIGDTTQTLDITGYQTRLRPGMTAPDVFVGGLLATGPNLGHFTRDKFSVVPEVTVNAGYWVTPVLKAYVGYNFMYWSNVLRPGDQIDRVVDLTLVPNPPPGVPSSGLLRPQPTFHQSSIYLNGIQFGLMGRW